MYRSKARIHRCCSSASVFLVLAVFSQAGCAVDGEAPAAKRRETSVEGGVVKPKIELQVEIASFRRGAIHDDFADGSFGSYDVAELLVTEEGLHRGAVLKIVQPAGGDVDSAFSAVGRRCVVLIDEWLTGDPEVLIPAADVELICRE